MTKEPGYPRGDRPPARKAWSLWKVGHLMECEINEHPLGFEARIYQRGEFQSSQVFPDVESAARDAAVRKAEFVAAGWTDRPEMPK